MNAQEIYKQRIEEASIEYTMKTRPICIAGDAFADMAIEINKNPAFISGATFALRNQWISVEEGLPPYDKEVIGMDYMPELALEQTIIFVHRSNNPNVITDKNKFCVYPPSFCKVTHWMPIPSLEGGEK
jgi:hypothetical protein